MSKRYDLNARITITAQEPDLDTLFSILEDEEKRVGSRAEYSVSKGESIAIDVNASDATALKTAISAISAIIRIAEEMNTIGEPHGPAPTSARDPR